MAQSPVLSAKSNDERYIANEARDGGVASVIVEFREPALVRSQLDSGAADVAAITTANRTAQDDILSDTFGTADDAAIASAGGRHVQRMDISPMFAFRGSLADIEALARHPDVVRIHADKLENPTLASSVPLIGMTQANMSGVRGTNQIVAVIDTGVMKTHTFLAGSVISEACYSNQGANGGNSVCPGAVGTSTAVGSGVNCDIATFGNDCKHGTHVAGIVAGEQASGSPARGVAPGVELIAIQAGTRNGSRVSFFNSDIIRALERVFAIRDSFPGKQVVAVNMSLGGGFFSSACLTDSRRPIIQSLRLEGILTVISAGNNARPLQVGAPGCIPEAITVGSSTDADTISSFSNGGPLVDVFAPGSDVISSVPTSTTSFESFNGTSMAAPHVAGAIAALREIYPTATANKIEGALEGRGLAIQDALTTVIKPRIRVNLSRNSVNAPMLITTNDSPIQFLGPKGGPFTPNTVTRILRTGVGGNTGFSFGNVPNWLSIAPATGTTNNSGTNIVFDTKPFANTRNNGVYAGQIIVNNGAGGQTPPLRMFPLLLVGGTAAVNNNFGGAIQFSTANVSVPGSNVGASTQPGEPTVQFMNGANTQFGKTVWWRINYATSGVKALNTLGSDFDTILCVYTGTAVNALSVVACNDFYISGDFNPARVTFNATAGTIYRVMVAGWNDGSTIAEGTYFLNNE